MIVRFHSAWPAAVLTAHVVPGRALPFTPVWDLLSVFAAPPSGSAELRALDASSVGGDFMEGDELRFQSATGALLSARLHVPDEKCSAAAAQPWLAAAYEEATLRLCDLRPFNLAAAAARHFDRTGSFLCAIDPRRRAVGPLDVAFALPKTSSFSSRRASTEAGCCTTR